jgi:hypothetical protein
VAKEIGGFDDVALWFRVKPPMVRPDPVLPLMPIFSGHGEPGATLVVRLVDKTGQEIGSQVVVVDAGGNWLATFASTVIYDEPHVVDLSLTAATYDTSDDGYYNLRTFFTPALLRGFFTYRSSSIPGMLHWNTADWMGALAAADEDPLALGQSVRTYELLAQQPTPSGY